MSSHNDDLWNQFHQDIVATRDFKKISDLVGTLKSSIEERKQQRGTLPQKIIDYLTDNRHAIVLMPPYYRNNIEVDHPNIIQDQNDPVLKIPYAFTLGGGKWIDVVNCDFGFKLNPYHWAIGEDEQDCDNQPVLQNVPEDFWVLTREDDNSIDWTNALESWMLSNTFSDKSKAYFDDVGWCYLSYFCWHDD